MVLCRDGKLEESAVDWDAVAPGGAEGAGAPASGDACAAELRIPKARPALAEPPSPVQRAGVTAKARQSLSFQALVRPSPQSLLYVQLCSFFGCCFAQQHPIMRCRGGADVPDTRHAAP